MNRPRSLFLAAKEASGETQGAGHVFSASGTTRRVAGKLAAPADAALFEIVPAVPYTRAGPNWTNKASRSSVKMQDAASRPAIAGCVPDMAAYEVVFLGFPIWRYVAPTIVQTFLESHDLSCKAVVPITTSGGSGLGRTVDIRTRSCPDSVVWAPVRLFSGLGPDAALTVG